MIYLRVPRRWSRRWCSWPGFGGEHATSGAQEGTFATPTCRLEHVGTHGLSTVLAEYQRRRFIVHEPTGQSIKQPLPFFYITVSSQIDSRRWAHGEHADARSMEDSRLLNGACLVWKCLRVFGGVWDRWRKLKGFEIQFFGKRRNLGKSSEVLEMLDDRIISGSEDSLATWSVKNAKKFFLDE